MLNEYHHKSNTSNILYSGPSILRPPMGPRKCGLILQVVLKQRSFIAEWHFGTTSSDLTIKCGLKIKGCKIEGLLTLTGIQVFVHHHDHVYHVYGPATYCLSHSMPSVSYSESQFYHVYHVYRRWCRHGDLKILIL